MPLEVIVLAAGQGKRMRSDLPKVLHPIGGRPLLAHVLDAARALAPNKTLVVHGHGAERVRAAHGDVERIVEEKDAKADERAIREINAGFMALSGKRLQAWLGKLSNRNAQNEYYLTDVVTLAVQEGVRVVAVKVDDANEVA